MILMMRYLYETRVVNMSYRVVAGSYSIKDHAQRVKNELEALGFNPFLVKLQEDKKLIYQVVIESCAQRVVAETYREKVMKYGYDVFLERVKG